MSQYGRILFEPCPKCGSKDYCECKGYGTIGNFVGMNAPAATGIGRSADHETGIVYHGPWEEIASGFSEHVRRNARALALTGTPVKLVSNQLHMLWQNEENVALQASVKHLTDTSIAKPWGSIEQLVPTDELLMRRVTHPFYTPEELLPVNRRKVLYTVWEREQITPAAAAALGRAGQAWVACQKDAEMLVRCGLDEEKVRVVPIPYFADEPLVKLRGRQRRPGPVRFYHIGKWEPRKEQRNIIGAFLLAFRPTWPALLFLKTSAIGAPSAGYPRSAGEAMATWLADERVKARGWTEKNVGSQIFLLDRQFTEAQIRELHRTCDVYVTLSRGEGFDLPAFEAKLAGNLMVYTPSGGPIDFASKDDLLVQRTGSIPAHPLYRWGKEATYLDYDLDAAACALSTAASRVKDPRIEHDLTAFRADNVGAHMLRCLEELKEKIS